MAEARAESLILVTTEKDMARIRSDARLARHADNIRVFSVMLDFGDQAAVFDFVAVRLAQSRQKTR